MGRYSGDSPFAGDGNINVTNSAGRAVYISGAGVKLIDNSFVGYPHGVSASNGNDSQIINNYFDFARFLGI